MSFVNNIVCLKLIHFVSLQVASSPVEPDCGCSGGFSRVNGVSFNLNCKLSEPICIDPPQNLQCGTPSFVGQYNTRGEASTTTVTVDGSVYAGSDFSDPPPITIILTHVRPVVYTNPIQFLSCAALVEGEACTSCEVCANGKSFKFDCSNIERTSLGVIQIPLPKSEECIGLNS